MRKALLTLMLVTLSAAATSTRADVPAAATQTAPAQAAPAAASQAPAPAATPALKVDKDHRLVRIDTDMGSITVRLDAERAELTVKNFLKYVKKGFYNGSSFYRVVPGFVIQGGDYDAKYQWKPNDHPIPNESGNGLSNVRGSIAMARDQPHTATAAFYINLVDNSWKLDPRPDRWGYAVFGQVVDGMDVVDKVAAVETGPTVKQLNEETPLKPVVITKVTLLPLPK